MFNKYKIVLTPFPFTDLSSSKIRPAIIVSDKIIGDDVIVSFISSGTKNISNLDLKIKKTSINGLKLNSVIKISKIATLDKKIILGEIGEIDFDLKKKMSGNLKKVFGL